MSRAICLGPWPEVVSGVPFPIGAPAGGVTMLCPRHAPFQMVALSATLELTFRILAAFRALPDVLLETGNDDRKLVAAMQLASPLCCHLGDEKMAELHQVIPALAALAN